VAYYLGIDGGGSKTSCTVGDEDSILATVVTGASNVTRVKETRARESLHQAIREACAAAGVAPAQLQRTCIGVAGAGRDEVAAIVRRIVAEMVPGKIEVVGDMAIALEAAFGAGPGVIVIAGTGSIAYGRDAQGRTARAGGWGFAISDEGSAHWIGRRAVREALRAQDEDPSSPFLEKLMRFSHSRSLDELVRAANSNMDFAALFSEVVAMAGVGNSIALGILSEAGAELAHLAAIVMGRLFLKADSSIPLAMAGGVFRYASLVREVFYNEIHRLHPALELRTEIVEPVRGALQMARRGG
jgi:glucosamine kinase